jgi:hypothetical protein
VADPISALFGTSWEGLSPEGVEAFLREAGDEGLTWEVKGDLKTTRWPRREQIEKAACGFANSRLGGVLIIGAERETGKDRGWILEGLEPPNEEETELAISRVIRIGVRPTPRFRIKVWSVERNRKAAIVWVSPVDQPPSITRDGRVFERTTGATEPVRDPAILSRLFAAGERARANAEEAASRAAERCLHSAGAINLGGASDWSEASSKCGRVGVGVAAAAYEPDIGGRLFKRAFGNAVEHLFGAELFCARASGFDNTDDVSLRQQRESVVARLDPGIDFRHSRRFALRAGWDGAVGVCCLEPEGASLASADDEVLGPMTNLASRLVYRLGGVGALHVAICGEGSMHYGHRWPKPEVPVRRWLELNDERQEGFEMAASDLEYVMNELYRKAGEDRWLGNADSR